MIRSNLQMLCHCHPCFISNLQGLTGGCVSCSSLNVWLPFERKLISILVFNIYVMHDGTQRRKARLIPAPACTCLQVQLHHVGLILSKGLTEPTSLVQISRSRWAHRTLTSMLVSKKAKMLAPGRGLVCSFNWQLD